MQVRVVEDPGRPCSIGIAGVSMLVSLACSLAGLLSAVFHKVVLHRSAENLSIILSLTVSHFSDFSNLTVVMGNPECVFS